MELYLTVTHWNSLKTKWITSWPLIQRAYIFPLERSPSHQSMKQTSARSQTRKRFLKMPFCSLRTETGFCLTVECSCVLYLLRADLRIRVQAVSIALPWAYISNGGDSVPMPISWRMTAKNGLCTTLRAVL